MKKWSLRHMLYNKVFPLVPLDSLVMLHDG
jgi:hypothetical protein